MPIQSHDRNRHLWMILFLAVAVVLGSGRLWRMRQSNGILPIAKRRIMTPLVLPQLDGGTWKLADHSGQVVLINYWATWCQPCREELPGLIQIARDSDSQRVALLGVALDSGPNAQGTVLNFRRQFQVPYPIAMPDAAARNDLGGMRLPTTVLLDKHGRIARTYYGAVEGADLAEDIASLQAEN